MSFEGFSRFRCRVWIQQKDAQVTIEILLTADALGGKHRMYFLLMRVRGFLYFRGYLYCC